MKRNEPRGLYSISTRQADPAYALVRALGALFLLSFLSMWAATEFVAWRFNFQHALGPQLAPYTYEPWSGIGWVFRYGHSDTARIREMVGEFWKIWGLLEVASFMIACAMVYRANRSEPRSDLHGSAHWPTRGRSRKRACSTETEACTSVLGKTVAAESVIYAMMVRSTCSPSLLRVRAKVSGL